MPACQIEEYHDTPQARDELIPWLVRTDAQTLSAETWRRRLSHWWDENPFSTLCAERGWLLRYEGEIAGFLGLIPACYAVNAEPSPAYIASTWRVDEKHRNASLPMLIRLKKLADSKIIADTTPTPAVKELLQRSGWRCLTDIRRRFVPLGLPSRLLSFREWPSLPPGRFITRDPALVRGIATRRVSCAGVQKWITPDYLRWFATSPMRKHEFAGVIDDAGCLSSYLFLTSKRIRGIPAWMEIDHFTTEGTHDELHALVGEIVRQPALFGDQRMLSLASFPDDRSWEGCPALHERTEHVCHCFAIPGHLHSLAKLTVLAEGDWGL
jgi:hypothetical protein